MEENRSDLDSVAQLLSSSGKLMDACEGYALAYLAALTPESLPTDGEDASMALLIYIKGLQNPESDLFIDNRNMDETQTETMQTDGGVVEETVTESTPEEPDTI